MVRKVAGLPRLEGCGHKERKNQGVQSQTKVGELTNRYCSQLGIGASLCSQSSSEDGRLIFLTEIERWDGRYAWNTRLTMRKVVGCSQPEGCGHE